MEDFASYSDLVLYKDEAVVLRTMRLGEADRIVTFLGRANGKIRAVAKGIRKTKSRFGGRLEPFSQVSLVLWRGRSSLDIVTQAEVVEPFRRVREDLEAFALGQVMLEAVDRLVQERERVPRVFTLVVDGLHALGASPSPQLLAWFLLRLSGLAGFAPHLERCAECRAPAGWFSPAQGGGVCRGCRFPDAEELAPGMLKLMSDLLAEGAWMQPRADMARDTLRLARWYTEFHLERRLRSARTAETLTGGLASPR
ncbi:MAG: DNA repair protein RecO [Actinomycetota bacterium]